MKKDTLEKIGTLVFMFGVLLTYYEFYYVHLCFGPSGSYSFFSCSYTYLQNIGIIGLIVGLILVFLSWRMKK